MTVNNSNYRTKTSYRPPKFKAKKIKVFLKMKSVWQDIDLNLLAADSKEGP